MNKSKLILFIIVGYYSLLNSFIINIPAEQPTIQAGINASVNGDTVLVNPGTYYENIDYLGKSITVSSLEMTTGNESYIASTIINGNQSGSCVRIADDITNAILRGFSITNGSGSDYYAAIRGGGILIKNNVSVQIINCSIFNNNAAVGGGLDITNSSVFFEGSNIYNNYAQAAGGLMISDFSNQSNITFDSENRCSIYGNYSGNGVDIYALFYEDPLYTINFFLDTFTVLVPQQYFAVTNYNYSVFSFDILNGFIEPVNNDLYVSPIGDDSNSGLNVNEPLRSITTALHKIYPDSLNPKTIHLAEGIYSRSANEQIFPIAGKKYVNIIGDNMNTTIIEAEQTGELLIYGPTNGDNILKNITFRNCTLSTAIEIDRCNNILFSNVIIEDCINENLTALFARVCNNLTFTNLITRNNIATEYIAGMYIEEGQNIIFNECLFENNFSNGSTEWSVYNSLFVHTDGEIRLNNCVFRDNVDYTNGGVGVFLLSRYFDDEADIKVNNCLIENNYSANGDALSSTGAIEGSVDIINCTFADNSGELSTLSLHGNANLTNNIFYNETPYEIFLPNLTSGGTNTTVNVSHCNIQNGIDGIYNEDGVNTINWLEGNLLPDEEPLFIGGENYQLSALSPCIDTGIQDTTGLFIPPWDLLNNQRVWDGDNDGIATIDMGCYEFGSEEYVGIIEPGIIVPTQIYLSNYPNPFNPKTTIEFSIPEDTEVLLSIYNIRGQLVKTLINSNIKKGKHQINWNGKNESGQSVSSGIYYCRLISDIQETVRKMILIK